MRRIQPSIQTSPCQLCNFIFRRRATVRSTFLSTSVYPPLEHSLSIPNAVSRHAISETKVSYRTRRSLSNAVESISDDQKGPLSSPRVQRSLDNVEAAVDAMLASDIAPPEQDIKRILLLCQKIADGLAIPDATPKSMDVDRSVTSALLSFEGLKPSTQAAMDKLSRLARDLLLHPTVFISQDILRIFVDIQATLAKPEPLPEILRLYSSKLIPIEKSSPITYKSPNPQKAANAVPQKISDRALDCALKAKRLDNALDIIDATYATTAFQRAKFVSRALVPATGLGLAPLAAYALATAFANYQTSMDPAAATTMAFIGITCYIGFTSCIGIVAITTANDQMERVTWATGMPLRYRWLREEERAALDKVSCAWGFQEKWRRGEEEGEEWEYLKEWIGRRGMVLDRVSLMEGME